MGTDGFEFVEYAAPIRRRWARCSRAWFRGDRQAPPQNVTLYRQGEVNFIINAEPDSFAQRRAAARPQRARWPSADARAAYERARLELGAWVSATTPGRWS